MTNVTSPYQDKLNYWSSHSQITRILAELPSGSRILDVGAGTGTLARLCSGRSFVIRAIEPNLSWLGSARSLYTDLFEGSLEQALDAYLAGHDAVVCADVLEHLLHPNEQLHRLVAAQPDHCIFIISVPNIANIWIRLNLLLGRFDYQDRGILDKTHLHFYTRKSFLLLLREAGLRVTKVIATPIPIDLVFSALSRSSFGNKLMKVMNWITAVSPTLMGYQWIARAVKSNNQ